MAVEISVTNGRTRELKEYKKGRHFMRNGQLYVLAIHTAVHGFVASLVNMDTGDSIRRLKPVASGEYITAEELKSLNAKKTSAAVCVE